MMRKPLFFLLILSIQFAIGQTDESPIRITQGTQQAELDFRYSAAQNKRAGFGTTSGDESKLFGISASYGVAVVNQLILGAQVAFKYAETVNTSYATDQLENLERFYGFGLYAKKYWNLSDRFLINGRLGVDYGFSKLTEGYTAGRLFRVGLRPGLTYFFTQHFALEGTFGFIGYTHTKLEDPDDFMGFYTKSNVFEVQFGASELSLGISYYF